MMEYAFLRFRKFGQDNQSDDHTFEGKARTTPGFLMSHFSSCAVWSRDRVSVLMSKAADGISHNHSRDSLPKLQKDDGRAGDRELCFSSFHGKLCHIHLSDNSDRPNAELCAPMHKIGYTGWAPHVLVFFRSSHPMRVEIVLLAVINLH